MRTKTARIKTRLPGLLIVLLCASLVAPVLAGAQEIAPTSDQYDSTLQVINKGSNDDAPPGGSEESGLGGSVGPLPFTGFDVIAMAAIAVAVAGLGLALQRAVSREPSDQSR
ncbi:MAG: hypothetical protein ACRDLO_11665 [Solirubrobacterales bacterium]